MIEQGYMKSIRRAAGRMLERNDDLRNQRDAAVRALRIAVRALRQAPQPRHVRDFLQQMEAMGL